MRGIAAKPVKGKKYRMKQKFLKFMLTKEWRMDKKFCFAAKAINRCECYIILVQWHVANIQYLFTFRFKAWSWSWRRSYNFTTETPRKIQEAGWRSVRDAHHNVDRSVVWILLCVEGMMLHHFPYGSCYFNNGDCHVNSILTAAI